MPWLMQLARAVLPIVLPLVVERVLAELERRGVPPVEPRLPGVE